jgi:putative transcriptional regulator
MEKLWLLLLKGLTEKFRLKHCSMKDFEIKKGDLLLSQPFMLDGNFRRSVVFLTEFNDEGAVGFIINRPMELKVEDLIPDFPSFNGITYFGGPVSTDTIHYVHRVGQLLEDSMEVADGIFWGGNYEQLKVLIEQKVITENDIRFFVGYSGWTAGQLEGELELGSWLKGEMDKNYIFNFDDDDMWKKALENKGDVYTVIANISDLDLLN